MNNAPNPLALILTYIYPPSRYCEIAGQRPLKFAKFLPDFGWDTVVITRHWDEQSKVSPYIVPKKDKATANLLNEQCIRNGVLSVPFQVLLRHRIAMLLSQKSKGSSISRSLAKAVTLSKLICPSQTQTNWQKEAKRLAYRIHGIIPIRAIIATSPPTDTLNLGYSLAHRLGVPWVADLRDRVHDCFPANFRQKYDAERCARIIRKANTTLVVSDALADSEAVDLALAHRPTVIPNGFDEDDYNNLNTSPTTFSVVYTGSLYPNRRDPSVFLMGLKMFYDKILTPAGYETPIFKYAGTSDNLLRNWIREHSIEHGVEILGHLPREETLRLQASAGILLHVTESGGATGIATGKIYEYFAAGRPILATPGDNSTADELINSTKTGTIAKSPHEVFNALKKWHDEWQSTSRLNYSPNRPEITKYCRRNQACMLSHVLNTITAHNPS
jgi:glycosyltransferase involved in cell wall biosynthesis